MDCRKHLTFLHLFPSFLSMCDQNQPLLFWLLMANWLLTLTGALDACRLPRSLNVADCCPLAAVTQVAVAGPFVPLVKLRLNQVWLSCRNVHVLQQQLNCQDTPPLRAPPRNPNSTSKPQLACEVTARPAGEGGVDPTEICTVYNLRCCLCGVQAGEMQYSKRWRF